MKTRSTCSIWRARTALLLALTGPLAASDFVWPKPEIKLRTAFTPASKKDNLNQGSFGFGFALAAPTAWGEFTAELGYSYKNGDNYAGPLQAAPANKKALDPRNSVEQKRNDMKGLTARFSMAWPLGIEDFDWQAGLMIGGTKFRQEFQGDSRSLSWGPTVSPASDLPLTWRDTYHSVNESSAWRPSPFAGVRWSIDKYSRAELNLVLLNYQSLDNIHMPGTASSYAMATTGAGTNFGMLSADNDRPQDYLVKKSRLWAHIEVGYTFRF